MSLTKPLAALMVFAVVLPESLSAQRLEKRHQLELRIGGWTQTTDARTAVGPAGVTTTVGSNGVLGGVAYGHWLQENLAFRITATIMSASLEVQVSGVGIATQFAGVMPVMFGMRYYLPKSTYGEQFRPFLGAGAGMFFGGQEITQTGTTVVTESRTEAAMGGELEAGVGILVSSKVMATVAFAYDLMTDFEDPIGGSSNYSGPQMTLGLSLLLGNTPR